MLIRTLIPVVVLVVGGVGVMSLSNTKGGQPPQARSLSAYQACVAARTAAGSSSGAAEQACRDRLPSGTQVEGFGAPPGQSAVSQAASQAFSDCMRSALARQQGGGVRLGGRFGGGFGRHSNRSGDVNEAVDVCRTIAQGVADGQGPAPLAPPPAKNTGSSVPVA